MLGQKDGPILVVPNATCCGRKGPGASDEYCCSEQYAGIGQGVITTAANAGGHCQADSSHIALSFPGAMSAIFEAHLVSKYINGPLLGFGEDSSDIFAEHAQ